MRKFWWPTVMVLVSTIIRPFLKVGRCFFAWRNGWSVLRWKKPTQKHLIFSVQSGRRNQKPKSVFAFRHCVLLPIGRENEVENQNSFSTSKTEARKPKNMLSFFDVEKQGSKSKNELHGISLCKQARSLTPSCSTHNWLPCQKSWLEGTED